MHFEQSPPKMAQCISNGKNFFLQNIKVPVPGHHVEPWPLTLGL